jgi:hypothetical protein
MLRTSLLLSLSLLSNVGLAAVSFQEKEAMVQELIQMQDKLPYVDIEGYKRELEYEKQNLTLDEKIAAEADLMANTIRTQIYNAYEASLINTKSEAQAYEEVKNAILNDITLADPTAQDELKQIALTTLDEIEKGGTSRNIDSKVLRNVVNDEVTNRHKYLSNPTKGKDEQHKRANNVNDDDIKSPNITDYTSKQQLMRSLVSTYDNSRWVFTSNQIVKTNQTTTIASNISLQVKFSFLGATISAGPTITFKRKYATNATIMAETLHPVILADGNFDYWKRDANNRIVRIKGEDQKRYIAFTCDADLTFETDYAGGGGFTFMGLGGGASVSSTFSNSVTLSSRRIALPEYVAGKTVTVKYISELCHNDFLNARYSNKMRVTDSLDVMMKNVVAGLEFSHPKTKCAVDSHCYEWFNREVIALFKIKNFPRCAEESREKFRSCQLRGLEGQACYVFENGKQTSSGSFEFHCDKGLRCVKYQDQTFFLGKVWQYSKGRCQIINKKTYRDPFQEAWSNHGIPVTLAD